MKLKEITTSLLVKIKTLVAQHAMAKSFLKLTLLVA